MKMMQWFSHDALFKCNIIIASATQWLNILQNTISTHPMFIAISVIISSHAAAAAADVRHLILRNVEDYALRYDDISESWFAYLWTLFFFIFRVSAAHFVFVLAFSSSILLGRQSSVVDRQHKMRVQESSDLIYIAKMLLSNEYESYLLYSAHLLFQPDRITKA